MPQYRVKDWSDFQHYKDRSPPWIRLHKRLLDNRRFHSLPDASRALAPMLWLLASEYSDLNSGLISGDDEDIAFRLRRTLPEIQAAIKPLIEKGFIEVVHDASDTLADRKQVAVPEAEAEAEAETNTEAEAGQTARAAAPSNFQRVYDFGCSLFPQLAPQGTSVIHQWLAGGASVELDILPEIRRVHVKGVKPRGWGLFTEDIASAKAKREAPLPPGTLRGTPVAPRAELSQEERDAARAKNIQWHLDNGVVSTRIGAHDYAWLEIYKSEHGGLNGGS